jgi:cell wall-associated NlpC family hydrolase
MLRVAKEYADAGTEYRIGCSGVPGTYADCSGLIYQCLYAIGINPDLNIVDHALAEYEYCSYYMAKDAKLGAAVDKKDIKAGDLVFYCNAGGGSVCHIAIYAGDNKIYDAWPGIGVTKRSINISGYSVCKVMRVII